MVVMAELDCHDIECVGSQCFNDVHGCTQLYPGVSQCSVAVFPVINFAGLPVKGRHGDCVALLKQ